MKRSSTGKISKKLDWYEARQQIGSFWRLKASYQSTFLLATKDKMKVGF
jgi:hypothetical protein